MGARILRIELRRSAALWAALLIAAVGLFVLFASNPPYGSWMELVIVQRDIMQLTWPLALAAGAWQGIRERRSRIEELIATTPLPRRWRVLPVAAAMAIAAVAAYLVMLAGAAGHLKHVDSYFPYGAVPLIALGALAMVAAVWLGLAIGSLLPSPLTAPLLVVTGFVGLALSPMLVAQDQGDPGTVLLFPYLRGPRDGWSAMQTLSARANLAQAVWLAALAVAGLALFAAARRGTRVAAVVPILIGAAIAAPAMPRHVEDAWIEDRRATETICTRDEPRVCVPRVQSYALQHLRGPARQALSILAAKLPPAPTQVVVWSGSMSRPVEPQPADTLAFSAPPFEDLTGYPPDRLVGFMLDGAGVRPCASRLTAARDADANADAAIDPVAGKRPTNNEARYLAARMAAAAWLLDRDVPSAVEGEEGPEVALAREAVATLRALPADEQRARVAALRDAERTCAPGDRLALLTGTNGTR